MKLLDKNCFVSWSGGKDSCLALHRAIGQGYSPRRLLSMFSLENGISSAHRLKEEVIRAQAASIGIECIIGRALFNDYEKVFTSNIRQFKEQGIEYGVFGDIDLEEHRQWEERVCAGASIAAVLPLWNGDRRELVREFIGLGFKARIVVVNTTMLNTGFLGRDLSLELMEELEACGADACGENGEYHTVVYDGPLFKYPVPLVFGAEAVPAGEQWAQIGVSLKQA